MNIDEKKIRNKLIDVIEKNHDDLSEDKISELAFHMTDWISDLEELVEIYQYSDKYSDHEIYDTLLKFCIHTPLHVVKAYEIIMDDKFSLLYNDYEST